MNESDIGEELARKIKELGNGFFDYHTMNTKKKYHEEL